MEFNKYIDTGIDNNNDKHCDIDGWFVNNDGDHKAVIRTQTDKSIKLQESKIYFSNAEKYFNHILKNRNDASYLFDYSTNDPNNIYSSVNLNKLLRNLPEYLIPKSLKERIDKIGAIINKSTNASDIKVYRGIDANNDSMSINEIINIEEGDLYIDKAFMSASYEQSIAIKYATLNNAQKIIIMEMDIKKGTQCIPLFEENNTVGSKKIEKEIIINKSTQFRVLQKSIIKENNFVIYYIKMVTK